jgi:hypothetical protein
MSDELNCSDGAKLLIERMKTNPEEFRGGQARWSVVVNQMLQVRRGAVENNLMMSRRDMNALFDAFETHVMEHALAEFAIHELMEPKPERKKVQVKRATPITASQVEKAALDILQEEFGKAYAEGNHAKARAIADEYEYRATGRYDLPDWKPYL